MKNVQTVGKEKLVPLHIEVDSDFKREVRKRAVDESLTVKDMTVRALQDYMSKPVKQASA